MSSPHFTTCLHQLCCLLLHFLLSVRTMECLLEPLCTATHSCVTRIMLMPILVLVLVHVVCACVGVCVGLQCEDPDSFLIFQGSVTPIASLSLAVRSSRARSVQRRSTPNGRRGLSCVSMTTTRQFCTPKCGTETWCTRMISLAGVEGVNPEV